MALIKCSECGKEISNKADVCIHCGCPLKNDKISYVTSEVDNIGKMNLYSVSEEKILLECDKCGKVYSYNIDAFSNITNDSVTTNANIGCKNCCTNIPRTTTIKSKNKAYVGAVGAKNSTIIKCPTCSSTDVSRVSAGEKVTNVALFGLFGNKRKMQFKCNNCKYMW